MHRYTLKICQKFDKNIRQKCEGNSKEDYDKLLYGVLNLLETLYSDYQANRDKIYSRSVGIITFCSAVFSLSFINYPNDLLLQANKNLYLFIFCMIDLALLILSFSFLTLFFVLIFWTRNRDEIDENSIVYKSMEDYYKYSIDNFLLALNEKYSLQVTSIKQYIKKIEKYFRLLLILSIVLIILSIGNLVMSSFMVNS